MGNTWIDNKGRLRPQHDENFQLITASLSGNESWLRMDSWDVARACRMVVFGYDLDVERTIAYGYEHCPEGTMGRDEASATADVINRALILARSAIAIGIIKDPDTPANWIAWAQSKGYKTDHLNPEIQAGEAQKALLECPDDYPGMQESYRERMARWQSPHLTVSSEHGNAPSGAPESAAPPPATVATPAAPTTDDDSALADLFDPVKSAQLEAMFPDAGKWKSYTERADRNGLKDAAKSEHGFFNPYRAAVWWLKRGPKGWTLERCLRKLANNLPARSIDSKHLLTDDNE